MAHTQHSKAHPKTQGAHDPKAAAAKARTPKGASPAADANEGEGNRTAARRYDQAAEAYAKSPRSDAAAAAAKRAVEGPERAELEEAETTGRARATDVEREADEGGIDREREAPPRRS